MRPKDVVEPRRREHSALVAGTEIGAERFRQVTSLLTRVGFIEPMTPALAEKAPEGPNWIHELKYDGYRTQLALSGVDRYAYTRRGHDWSHLYASLLDGARRLGCESALIEGEVIVQNAHGVPDFDALRRELARRKPRGLIFMAFDLLHLNGQDLRNEPVEERRQRLRELVGENESGSCLQYSDHVAGNGPAFFTMAEQMGLEGIISKKLGTHYRSGPTKTWLKVKAFTEDEFIVIGTSRGDRAPVALLARETEDHRLEYAGAAMVTFSEQERERFWRANERLKTSTPALHMDPRPETSWLKPEMRVMVRHLRGEEMLRHATVKAITHLPEAPRSRSAATARKEPAHYVEHGVVPDRADLLDYYRAVAPLILPHIAGRPLNLFRCQGRYCFFQRNRTHPETSEPFDEPIHKIPILQKNGKTEDYLHINDLEGLLACVEVDTVEFHAWGSRVPDYERPDRIAFDLDPGEGVSFDVVKSAAFQLRRSLQAIGLESWAMLTGGKGIHVVLPFEPAAEWPEVRAFARQFCATLADAAPDLYTVALPKAQRRGRIFLDYLRNQRTATAVMPYSARARPGTPVAVPVGWEELEGLDRANCFTIDDLPLILARSKELGSWSISQQRLP